MEDEKRRAAQFDQILKSRRDKGVAVRRVITEDDMKNWTSSRVIPYIDMLLWERATGRNFRPIDIQNALFGKDTIEQVGREPKKIFEQSTTMYAERLLSAEYFETIVAQLGDLEDQVEMLAVLLEPDEAEQTAPHLH